MEFKKEIMIPEEIIEDCRRTIPAAELIKDEELREKVIRAWAWALFDNGYKSLSQLPGNGNPDGPEIGTQAMHINGVARLAVNIMDDIVDVTENMFDVDRDLLVAAALCHDIGKPFESAPENRSRWEADSKVSGLPALRHPAAGAYVAFVMDLPEVVMHTAGCHSPEGRFVTRSLITTIVNVADEGYWRIVERANDITVVPM